jgi:uncharacterized protein (TIRG00374 family)
LVVGIAVGIVFTVLALHKVDLTKMREALQQANYWYVGLATVICFVSHYFRTLRWRYLLKPLGRFGTGRLFSALMIGYMGNVLLPGHLGEVLRAYALGKKGDISASAAFATIVTERIIDVLFLILIMFLAAYFYPFPAFIRNSTYVVFTAGIAAALLLVGLKRLRSSAKNLVTSLLRPFPDSFRSRLEQVLDKFISGLVPLQRSSDYLAVVILSVAIWACYAIVFYCCLDAFGFRQAYRVPPWSASLVLLVTTMLGVAVPSSPGYVGTYHYLCQIALTAFAVPRGPALSFAVVAHGVNFLPVLFVGLGLYCHDEIRIFRFNSSVKEGQAVRGDRVR